jgi:hypothetical protein
MTQLPRVNEETSPRTHHFPLKVSNSIYIQIIDTLVVIALDRYKRRQCSMHTRRGCDE